MTTPNLFQMKCQHIKDKTAEALAVADMFNGFRYHQPSMTYHDVKQAAANMRACADVLDELADKLAPGDPATMLEITLMAAE